MEQSACTNQEAETSLIKKFLNGSSHDCRHISVTKSDSMQNSLSKKKLGMNMIFEKF